MVEIHLDPYLLERYGLPAAAYSVPSLAAFAEATAMHGRLPAVLLLKGLQEVSSESLECWTRLKPAMDRLALLVSQDNDPPSCSGTDAWWVELGAIRWDESMVTLQRSGQLIATLVARADGRLRLTTFQPLDARACGLVTALSAMPHPKHGVSMRADNWEFALDCAAGMGNVYAAERDESCLSLWEHGLGMSNDGTKVPDWFACRTACPHPSGVTSAMLAAHVAAWPAGGLH